MTEWFEVLDRDGPARIGELRLTDPVQTPCLADEVVEDAGSRWSSEPASPPETPDVVTLGPHRGLPTGTPNAVAEAFAHTDIDRSTPHGLAIDGQTADDHGADVYALSSAQGIVGHAAAYRKEIVTTREAIPDDSALYLSGVATPANAAFLVWSGVDLVDTASAAVAGSRGEYLTPTDRLELDSFDEPPCACSVCAATETLDEADCIDHNINALVAELATIRHRVRTGRLREFVAARCRHTPWLTAALREFDQEGAYLEARTPIFRRARIDATTADVLQRVEITRFVERVTERYRCRFGRPLVLLPCSATKPYSQSQSHRQFRDAIQHRAHRVALSSPVGVVPQELECTYPAQHYETPVTGRWTANERAFVTAALEDYLDANDYPWIIAHVPPGGYEEIVRAATADRDTEVIWTVEDHPTTEAALSALEAALDGELAYSRRRRRLSTVRALADYQFGPGAGDELFPSDAGIEAPYPKHRVDVDGDHLATMVPEYGLLALTLAGGRRWAESAVPTRSVTIDAFVPHGNVLAPGIEAADPSIRPGDEVFVHGPAAEAVGRATAHGNAMQTSTRGVAVDVRHSEAT